ncbi:hypothetical protein F7R91_38135 [Streptomyces luteolifulvus]|uniref:Uncharacterized protein n=1 Tax=Streptomyces luteolifulvus TaxID=2615112 RepID=A0A6H9UPL7_9ACTN|nr:hypothetical protein [Streptomyces luteolifulvus]KAB1139918.1 hypothetical protein F7R91_38135 [Streptomyces luteolifulvus]
MADPRLATAADGAAGVAAGLDRPWLEAEQGRRPSSRPESELLAGVGATVVDVQVVSLGPGAGSLRPGAETSVPVEGASTPVGWNLPGLFVQDLDL